MSCSSDLKISSSDTQDQSWPRLTIRSALPNLRVLRALVVTCLFSLIAGCVLHENYAGDAAIDGSALVVGYWHYRVLYDEELQIVSVDGAGNGDSTLLDAYSVSLDPGSHWLQVALKRNGRDILRCAVEWEFAARSRYKITALQHDQTLLAHPSASPYKAALIVEVSATDTPTQAQTIPATCATAPLCLQDTDCAQGFLCTKQAEFEFGTCESPSR